MSPRPWVLMLSPGFPKDMQYFTRGLARVGARVVGVGDQPESGLPEEARKHLAAYVRVSNLNDADGILGALGEITSRVRFHRVECLWEPYLLTAAQLRERLGLPGMTVQETVPFRDKEVMKRVLDAAGIRTPHHYSATTSAQVVEAANTIGFPVIVKPIAGAGSESTYKVHDADELQRILPALASVTEVSVEEFVEGDDMTFDTICVDGQIAHYNISTYRPRALTMKGAAWISPITITLPDVDDPLLASGREMGMAVHKALGVRTGYTHMEWYRTRDGEAVFGEIAHRSPGAHLVDLINYASDTDTYTGWAEAVVHGRFTQPTERLYSAAWIFKRARGQGVIQRYEGLESILARFGSHICVLELNPIGQPRKDWRKVLKGDGMVIVRHPDFQTNLSMSMAIASDLHIVAG